MAEKRRLFDMTADLNKPRENKTAPVKKRVAKKTGPKSITMHVDAGDVNTGSAAVAALLDRWDKWQNKCAYKQYLPLKLKTWTLRLTRFCDPELGLLIDRAHKTLRLSVVNHRGNLVSASTLCGRLDRLIEKLRDELGK